METEARAAESQKRTAEAWLLRSRLEKGDFQEGDRIVVVLEASAVVMDTLQVRSGKVLQLPKMGDLSLAGVLRSELTDTLRSHLAKYLKSPVVRATALLPIAVLGDVNSPGYYYTPADVVLRDLIMRAGGPMGTADLNKVVVRRGGDVIWNANDIRVALNDGLSLDGLHLRAGDELFVPQRRKNQWSTVFAVVSTTVGMLGMLQYLSR